jgi:Uncharacterised protein family UPF0547
MPEETLLAFAAFMDAQAELVRLLREEASEASEGHAKALRELADGVESLPKSHRTVRVLRALPPHERKQFPNPALRALIASYGLPENRDVETFLNGVIDAIYPGMGRMYVKPDRPWWATLPFSPLIWLVWSVRRRKKTCPSCAERVKRRAVVCRFCGYRFS